MATAVPDVPALERDLAFERLYRRYVKDVYHYALALLRNPADAEDVTQTTFLNAYRAFKRGERPRKPENWLIKIAHNAARTRYARSTRRVKEVPLADHVDALVVPEEEKPDVAEVLDALGQLPLNQRGALVMRELEGRSYAEIADTLGVSVPAVETLIFRARRSLRLKSSAVRVLSVVQLPPSLAHFFDGGTIVAGGGAAIGSGFLFKAAVALVAGAVATGVAGGHHSHQAEAARPAATVSAPTSDSVVAPARSPAARTRARHTRAPTARAHTKRRSPHRRHAEAQTQVDAPASATAAPTPPATSIEAGAPHGTAPAPTATTTSAPTVQTATVEQVSNTVESVTQTLPPLPVTPPTLPSTPTLPAVPSVPAPQLPPPPTLP